MNSADALSNITHLQSPPVTPEEDSNPADEPPLGSTTLPPAQIALAMKISAYEAFPAQIFVTLTGGVFMPAFALTLGANNFYIGALAAIPFFANLFQLAGAYFVENYRGRKELCLVASCVPRLLWAPAIIVTLFLVPQDRAMIRGILLVSLVLVHGQLAVSGVAWLSWMNDVVPDGIRGRYFGLRNSVVSIATSLATFAGGWFLDVHNGSLGAFCALFVVASGAGVACSLLLIKQPEPAKIFAPRHKNFFQLYSEPFKQPNFRRSLRFSVIWQFAVNVASPFFVVYTLTELGASYALTATYTVITAVFELLGMRVWGHVSDRTGNKPVITIAVAVVGALPWLWLLTLKNSFSLHWLLPVLYAVGGFSWAAYNLCSTNLMFRLAPRERNSIYFGAWAACNGLAACAGSLFGGVLGKWAAQHQFNFFLFSLTGLKIVFLSSGVLRLAAAWLLRPIEEVKGMHTRQALQLMRHVQNWRRMLKGNSAAGSNGAMPEHSEAEKLWPLFGRRDVDRPFSDVENFRLSRE